MGIRFKSTGYIFLIIGISRLAAQAEIINPQEIVTLAEITPTCLNPISQQTNITYISPQSDIRINFDTPTIIKVLERKYEQIAGVDQKRLLEEETRLKQLIKYLNTNAGNIPDSLKERYAGLSPKETLVEKERLKVLLISIATKKNAVLKTLRFNIKMTAFVVPKIGRKRDLPVPGFSSMISDSVSTTISHVVRSVGYENFNTFKSYLPSMTILPLTREKLQPGDQVELIIANQGIEYRKVFEVVYYGWHKSVQPTFHFVQRVSEPKDSAGEASYPSNFKPAPGAVFYIKFYPKTGFWKKLLTPGFGINATLLDFEKDNNLELGVGVSVSTIDDAIVFGYGWSLHSDEKRAYRFIGINFIQTMDVFKGFFNQ